MKAMLGSDRQKMEVAIKRYFRRYLILPVLGHFGFEWRHDVSRISRLFARVPVVATDGLLSAAPFARAGQVAPNEIMVVVSEGWLPPASRRHDVACFHGLLHDPALVTDLWPLLRGEMPRRCLAEALRWMSSTTSEFQHRLLVIVEGYDAVRVDALASPAHATPRRKRRASAGKCAGRNGTDARPAARAMRSDHPWGADVAEFRHKSSKVAKLR
ncbi:hypothetical protein [Sphingomonas sp. Y38-1Y]|uniref:hypothetical protein n=1 Tax=Sphingomonas sp. Y38-1Y TaxID=3078265 RepID=UPI0028EEE8B0|nr:hypothetical protein [Sphingomonas sp. Y38-1Y]